MCSHSLSTWTPMKCGWNDTCTKVCKSSIRGGGRGKVGNFFHFKEFEFWRRLQNKQWRTLSTASGSWIMLQTWAINSISGLVRLKFEKKLQFWEVALFVSKAKINVFFKFLFWTESRRFFLNPFIILSPFELGNCATTYSYTNLSFHYFSFFRALCYASVMFTTDMENNKCLVRVNITFINTKWLYLSM